MTTHINIRVQSWAFLSLQMCLQISFFIPMEARSLCLKKEKCSGILFYHWVLSRHDVFFSNLFIYLYLFLAALGLRCCTNKRKPASFLAASGGYSSLWSAGCRHAAFSSCGSRALEHRLSSSGALA